MKYTKIILCILSLFAGSVANGQQNAVNTQQRERTRYVAIPSENALLVIAAQPDCPLVIEDARLFGRIGGGDGVSYQVRNRGTKPIRTYTLAMRYSVSTGWSGAGMEDGNALIMPGQTFRQDCPGDVVPLTDELRDRLRLRGAMKAVAVLMVEKVVFADGTTYSDEATSRSLQAYFEGLAR